MFAERLKSLRKEQNLTQQKIAEKLNISRGSYAQWEAQRTQPSSKSLETLANFFDVSTDYLLGNTDIKNQNQFDEDLEKSLDTFKSFDGKPMYDEDREKIREFLRKRMEDRLKDNWYMLSKIKRLIKELGIEIQCMEFGGHGYFGIENNKPIIFINENLNEIDTSLTLLHETAHFLNEDGDKYITNHFQNDNLEFEANKYMIREVLKMLDEKYDFTTDTNYQQIIDNLNLPYHLDGVIIDEFNSIISDKFGMTPYCETDYFYE